MGNPENFKYTKDHEWAKVEGSVITVGITNHAQGALGDVVFVDLPETGRVLKVGESFGVVESIKAVSDLYSPVAGKVIATNPLLKDEPAKVNTDPYGSAWMVKIECTEPTAVESLMDGKGYSAYVATLK